MRHTLTCLATVLAFTAGLEILTAVQNPMYPDQEATVVDMRVPTDRLARFTPANLGRARWDDIPDDVNCEGRLTNGGAIRYFVNGSVPYGIVGHLLPAPQGSEDTYGGTREGDVVTLYGKDVVSRFLTIAAAGHQNVELVFECYNLGKVKP